MNKSIILLTLISSYSFSGVISTNQVNYDKSMVQVAVMKSKENLNSYIEKFSEYDLVIEKKKNYTLYLVNIEKDEKSKVINDVRQSVSDAFFVKKTQFIPDEETKTAIVKEDIVETIQKEKQDTTNSKSYTQSTFELALKHFKKKEYEKSYELLNKIFFNDMGNTLINFYLGRSAYETERYEFAISAYERILIQEPDNNRVRLELAQTYLKMNLYVQSLKEFKLALEGKLPPTVRKRVETNIAFMENKQKKHFFDLTALVGLIYDSNVDAAPDAGTFNIYSPTLNNNVTLENEGNINDTMILQLAAVMFYKYKPSDNFFVDTKLTPLLLDYEEHSEKNINALSLNISPTFINKDEKYIFSFLVDKVYQDEEGYQFNYYLDSKFSKLVYSNLLYELSFKVGRIDYDDEEKDANSFLLKNVFKYVTKDYGLFSFNLELGKDNEIQEERTDVSLKSYNFSVENSYAFSNGYSLISSLGYKITKYDDLDVNFLTKREDKKADASLTLQKAITDNAILTFGATFTDNDSNHESFIYDKHTLKTNFIYNF